MYHHPSRAAKTGRVVARDGTNFGLQYSLQAQATPVIERPYGKQGVPEWKQNTSGVLTRPSSNTRTDGSTRYRHTISPPQEFPHSSMDGSQESKQNYATLSFRELHKIQRQVLQPAPAYVTDQTATGASGSLTKMTHESGYDDSLQSRHSFSAGSQSQSRNKSQVFLPGDRVIFAESPSAPGVPIVYRLPEERQANPDRLNLDRRRLTTCPILEGEDYLRLLNFQHNLISRIYHLENLKRLIFLDFYDNQIEEISGLSSLRSLRVLMLGKNRIRKINNLDSLTKLDVLDLHGNKIVKIENLGHLTELRVLNLAGNEIVSVCNVSGMRALAELNLRRNQISTVEEVDLLPNIQRLFLSFNCITSFDDISCLSNSSSLNEVSLDGNPFSSDPSYKQILLRNLLNLRQLDMKRISEEEKRIASVMARKEEEKKKEISKLAVLKEKRRIAINNAQRQWEVSRIKKSIMPNSQTTGKLSSGVNELLAADGVVSVADSSNTMAGRDIVPSPVSICHLAELDNDMLYLYGPGSLDALDRNWGNQAVQAVTGISFKFIDFDLIVPQLHKIRARFPSLVGLIFMETNIKALQQINSLSLLRRLDYLSISEEGNPVMSFSLLKPYVLFRLAHFSLRRINDIEVTTEDTVNAEKLFGTLAHITTSQLPQSRLLTMLGDSRRKQTLDTEKNKKPEPGKHERTPSNESVSRAGLQYWPADSERTHNKEAEERRSFAVNYMKEIAHTAILTERKKKKLDEILPELFAEMVQKALVGLADLNSCMKGSLEKIKHK
ncbi:leucine-rich repeat-containing protein 49-like [Montipora foliosa]|uniref:leucine-rich repeat-containing protein 49-like n=1 Tax=Montipora foliosa TaxID=591990 RepID=UPI0035F10E4C